MRIVVTGAAGFVGSHLVERLLSDGHSVVGVDCFVPYYPRRTKEANLQSAQGHAAYVFHELDLRQDDLIPVFAGADAVIHEAAMPGLPRSWTDFDLYLSCNVQATQRVLEACRLVDVKRLVLASTSSVYGMNATSNELGATAPVSPYGVTKLAAEELARAYSRSFGLDVVICRYFSIFGPRQRPDMAYHIFARALLEGRPIVVFGDGQQSRGNTYVGDCVDGTVRSLHDGRSGQTYNLGGGTEITLIGAIRLLESATSCEARLEYRPTRLGDQRQTLADSSKARNELGWLPTIDIAEGLRREVEWVRESLMSGTLSE